MARSLPLHAILFTTMLGCFGCAPDAGSSSHEPTDGSPPAATPAPSPRRVRAPDEPSPARIVVAWTADGDLALVDGAKGAVLDSSPGAHFGGVRDAIVDAAEDRIVAFEGDAEGTWGEIATYSLNGDGDVPALGPRVHRAWIDGDARVAAAPGGILVFSDGPARQWRILRDDGAPAASSIGPRPVSLVVRNDVEREAPDLVLDALGVTDDGAALVIQGATVHAGALALAAPEELETGAAPSTPRLAALPALDAAVLVDADHEGLVLRTTTAEAIAPPHVIGLGAAPGRVEAAVTAGAGDVVAMLTSGPPRVVVAGFVAPAARRRGEPPVLADVTARGLDGNVRVEDRFFSRDLAVVGARTLLVATDAGIVAFRLEGAADDLAVEPLPAFDGAALRGPIAGALP